MGIAGHTPNFVAAATILPFSCVKTNASDPFRVEPSTAEMDVSIGVTDGSTRAFDSVNHALAGDLVNLQNGEFLQLRAGGTIAIGDGLRPTTAGAVILATDRISFVAAENAVAGEIFWAQRVGTVDNSTGALDIAVSGTASNGFNYTFNLVSTPSRRLAPADQTQTRSAEAAIAPTQI